jgi:hypothetical protein
MKRWTILDVHGMRAEDLFNGYVTGLHSELDSMTAAAYKSVDVIVGSSLPNDVKAKFVGELKNIYPVKASNAS